jgi:hypothetical protein
MKERSVLLLFFRRKPCIEHLVCKSIMFQKSKVPIIFFSAGQTVSIGLGPQIKLATMLQPVGPSCYI